MDNFTRILAHIQPTQLHYPGYLISRMLRTYMI